MGFIAQQDWSLWGVFNQNVFTISGNDDFRDVDISIIQPIANYQLGDGWSIGTSDMSITYDWKENKFVSLPLGVGINKIQPISGTPVQFSMSYEHNFYDEGVVPKDTVNFTAKILIAKK